MKTIGEDKEEKDLTVRDVLNSVINGVEVVQRQQKPLTPEETGRIYQLSTKLWDAKEEIELTVEEASFIKDRAGKVANINPLVYGRVCDILEEKHGKEKSKKG